MAIANHLRYRLRVGQKILVPTYRRSHYVGTFFLWCPFLRNHAVVLSRVTQTVNYFQDSFGFCENRKILLAIPVTPDNTQSTHMNLRGENTLEKKLYRTWVGMWNRCANPRCEAWFIYGARGISVCERWDSFTEFAADMGLPPSLQHSIDRINPYGNYEPSNCRWATKAEQARNKCDRTKTKSITYERMAGFIDDEVWLVKAILSGEIQNKGKLRGILSGTRQTLKSGGFITARHLKALNAAATRAGYPVINWPPEPEWTLTFMHFNPVIYAQANVMMKAMGITRLHDFIGLLVEQDYNRRILNSTTPTT